MRTEKDNQEPLGGFLTLEQITKQMLMEVEDVAVFNESLHEMFVSFVEQIDSGGEYIGEVTHSYSVIRRHIKLLSDYQKQQKQLLTQKND